MHDDRTRLHAFPDREALAEALAERTLAALTAGLEAHPGGVTWAVSGGSTPRLLFGRVAEARFPWDRVHVALVDERWVPFDHPRSNEAFVARELAPLFAQGAKRVGMYDGQPGPDEAVAEVDAAYRRLPPIGPCLLGLGPDGHTASLFPGAQGLEAALDPEGARWVAALRADRSEVTGAEVERMSLTVAALRQARFPHLLIAGEDKRAALERAAREPDLPIARVLAALTRPLEVFWAP